VDLKHPVATEVEYLPGNPSVHRLKGEGSQNLGRWFFRTALFAFLLAICARPGIALLLGGLHALQRIVTSSLERSDRQGHNSEP
jgi:hypothetical protein